MMDLPPDKRPRLSGPPPPTSWQNSPEGSRQLPSPTYNHPNPFSRPSDPHPLDHRRPSEHSPYDHQDPRRPNSGPSHGYHNGPPQAPPPPPSAPPGHQPQISPYAVQRDPMVKRDSSDEPQQYRPPSTGVDHNVNPSPHQAGPGRPFHPPYDPARNQQYQPPPPPNSYPPVQSPMSATEPYGNTPYGPAGLPPPRDYQTVTYPSARGPDIRKKAQRAAQACDSCRTLKAKCDEGRPACSTCKEKGTDCRYRDPPPKQQDKASADIIESLQRLESFMSGFNNKIEHVNQKIENLAGEMRDIRHAQNGTLVNRAPHEPIRFKNEHSEPVSGNRLEHARLSIGSEYPQIISNESPYGSTLSQPRAPDLYQADGGEASEEEEESGNPGPSRPSSIPVNHTTGAARLLNVPAIRALCQGAMDSSKIKNERYPITQEEKRGLLRLYGRGEGYESPPGYDKDSLVDHGADGTPGDSHSDVSSPAGEEWGQLGGLTPPTHQPDLIRGGINANGMPDFSRETVNELVKSYMDNINIMHPILIQSRLDILVEHFLRSIPESQAKPKQVSTLQAGGVGFVGSGGYRNPESPGNKRKRSPIAGEYAEPHAMLDHHKPGHPFRSIGSAIVLLVMALGKICQHRGKIPDAWNTDRDPDPSFGSSPMVRNGHPPSPIQSSPSMRITSPMDGERGQPRSRKNSIDNSYPPKGFPRPRNIDIIPGLAYHALATDVIGNQLAGNSLQHVHANILAGLYHGQLARVMESHGYIAAACRGLQVILRPKLDRLKKIKEHGLVVPEKDNPLVIAFWSCLQLESDIVAELPCPHSGILTYEEDMPHPHLQVAVDDYGFNDKVIESYIGQLFLRKHLNQLHNMFYRPDVDGTAPFNSVSKTKEHFPTIDASLANLRDISLYTTAKMKWETADGEPARDILEARIRAKYYGAEVITYRHFILKVLESDPRDHSVDQVAPGWLPKFEAPFVKNNLKQIEDLDAKVLNYVECGIRALIFSTKAFYGLGDPGKVRLIVTNVWGTAHAQWGNMVTLLAAYRNPILEKVVLKFTTLEGLRYLTERTLGFLNMVASPTSALHSDYKILKFMAHKTGILPSQGPNNGSSFSSSTTGDIPMSGH